MKAAELIFLPSFQKQRAMQQTCDPMVCFCDSLPWQTSLSYVFFTDNQRSIQDQERVIRCLPRKSKIYCYSMQNMLESENLKNSFEWYHIIFQLLNVKMLHYIAQNLIRFCQRLSLMLYPHTMLRLKNEMIWEWRMNLYYYRWIILGFNNNVWSRCTKCAVFFVAHFAIHRCLRIMSIE